MSVSQPQHGPGVGPFGQSPQARWKIVDQPAALPGCCFMCNGSYEPEPPIGRQWFVDTGMNMEWHGAIYICNLCLGECATTAGWMTPGEALALKDEVKALQKGNFHLQTELAALHDLEASVATFVQSRDRRTGHPGSDGDGQPVPLYVLSGSDTSPEDDGDASSGPSGTEDHLGAGTGASPESVDDEGVDDVRSDAGESEFRIQF